MKKTDLEKFKGKKLDIRKSQENAFGKHTKAKTIETNPPSTGSGPASLMDRLLGKVINNH
jgi:hypothetical protein